jgi:hypothetical protein
MGPIPIAEAHEWLAKPSNSLVLNNRPRDFLQGSAAADVGNRVGTWFQTRRAIAYFRRGELAAIEAEAGTGRIDLVLTNGLQIDTKSWLGWNRISETLKQDRLATLGQQIETYLSNPEARLLLEFRKWIPPEVTTALQVLGVHILPGLPHLSVLQTFLGRETAPEICHLDHSASRWRRIQGE